MCAGYSKLAKTIMELRQDNISMPDMYNALKDSELSIEMLKAAFKVPLYSTEDYKQNAVNEFANDVFLACIGV